MAKPQNADEQAHITTGQAQEALNKATRKVKELDVEKIVQRKKEIDDKIRGVPGKFGKMVNQVRLLFEMVGDYWKGDYRAVPWETVAMAVGAIVYFLSPVDLIPDVIPVIGYLDDAMVVALAVTAMQENLRQYCAFKKYDVAQYFD